MAILACNGFAASDSGADSFIQDHFVGSGAVHWVDSVNGNDSNTGTEGAPLATLAQAITNTTANNGDVVLIKSGHAEVLAAPIAINKAGLRIFGIGNGTAAPSFTVAAAIDGLSVTAADVEINNLYFPAGTTAINTARINVSAARVLIKNCRFNCGAFDTNTITLATGADSCELDSVSMTVTADGPDSGVVVEDDLAGFRMANCSFNGGSANFDVAAVYSTAAPLNYRLDSITLANDAGMAFTNPAAKGVIGNLAAGDGSQVQA